MNLFEQILKEASKARFIDPVWEDLEKDPVYVMSQTKFPETPLPDKETITKWIDSGAANSFLSDPIFNGRCFNWQKFTTGAAYDDIPYYVYLINAYLEYKQEGGSRKQKKDNPKNCFKEAKISAIFLNDIETDRFFFVSPVCHDDAEWMDSFDCCGAGARWCIGYEQSDEYWDSYVHGDNDLFILAVDKENYKKARVEPQYKDDIKYMIQIDPDTLNRCCAWRQSDDPSDCISAKKFKKFFGRDLNELIMSMAKNVLIEDNEYESDVWISSQTNEPILYDEDEIKDDTLYFKEMIKGSTFVSRDDIYNAGYSALKIDFEGSHFDGTYFSGLKNGDKNTLRLSDFVEWAKVCGIDNCSCATFYNAGIKNVIFDVTPEQYPFDFYFDSCVITELYIDEKVKDVRTIDSQITLVNSYVKKLSVPDQTFTDYILDRADDSENGGKVADIEFRSHVDFAEELKSSPKTSNGGDCSNMDVALLPDLENKDYIFAIPITEIGSSYLKGRLFGMQKAHWNFLDETLVLKGQIPVVAFNKDIQKYAHSLKSYWQPFSEENYALKELIVLDPSQYFSDRIKGVLVENLFGVNNYKASDIANYIKMSFGITIHDLINSIKKNIGPYNTRFSDNIKDLDNPEFIAKINEIEPLIESKIFERALRLS